MRIPCHLSDVFFDLHYSVADLFVSTEAIADYLSRFPTIECVFLNSCYSDKQAEAIVRHIPYVIGMSSDILDKAALKFAQGFYNALGADLSYEAAYDNGKYAIALAGIPQSQIPILKQKAEKRQSNPESL